MEPQPESRLSQPLPHILQIGDIEPTISRHISQHEVLVNNLIEASKKFDLSFNETVRPLADLENSQAGEQSVIWGLKYFSPHKDVQIIAEQAECKWNDYFERQKPIIFHLLQQVMNNIKRDGNEGRGRLDQESLRLLDKMIQECNGDCLTEQSPDAETMEKVQERKVQINQLCTEINRNLRHYRGGEWFSADEVDGVPLKHQEAIPEGRTDGRALYPHDEKYFTIMRYAHSSNTRRRMLQGRHSSHQDTAILLRKVVLLRDENARALGFKNHAAFRLSSRCVDSIEWVEEMLHQLEEALLPVGKKQFERVKAKKRRFLRKGLESSFIKDTVPSDLDEDCLTQWEYLYYDAMPDEDSDSNRRGQMSTAEWFPVRFDPLRHQSIHDYLWHPDVRAWAIWDKANGEFVGYLFADLLSRPHKYKGNQAVNIQPGYLKPDGTRVYPANILMCNLSNSSLATGCLLEHANVVTIFHELGHSIHDLVARTRYARFHGYAVALELGEGIGMMLEQFCWQPDVIRDLSCHYTRVDQVYADHWRNENPGLDLPSRLIPDSLFQKRSSKRKAFKANKILGMLIEANFDLEIHNTVTPESLTQLDLSSLYKDIYKRLKFRDIPDTSVAYAQHGLLVSGYDAGYYSYLCAEVLAADFFQSNFAQDARSRPAWRRFRDSILGKGGSQDEMSMIRALNNGRSIDVQKFLLLLDGAIDQVEILLY